MSERERMRKWAERNSGPAPGPSIAPPPPVPQAHPGYAPQAAPVVHGLPQAPPGYAYGWRPDVQAYVLVPLTPVPVYPPQYAPQYPAPQPYQNQPPYQPPQHGQHPGAHPGARVIPFRTPETCMVVKPDPRDPWAATLATLPDLAPDGGDYDAMQNNMSPESRDAIAQSLGSITAESGQSALRSDLEYGRRPQYITKVPPLPGGS